MTPAVSAKLLELTNDHNNEVKLSAIYALGESASATPAHVNRLLALSSDLNHNVKVAAIKALGRITRPKQA
ncbi:HEAT repeat domain-containing protein [Enterobacter kobei]|uniref:HEAT repeat domain-containing protein n=1 Tax=Enterobacteriaceae TaxID=543 RepID=UPI0019053F98|nr:HEAT repeat domain-containing protein [Citrobacter freundii]MBJ9199208.1 HEAT repeat domain-containing protein [Citrobacter freundii]